MPRLDTDHAAVKAALVKAGWTITHDPLTLEYGRRNLFVDLGAESEAPIGAEKEGRKIAVEVKSFRGKYPNGNTLYYPTGESMPVHAQQSGQTGDF